MPDKYINNSKRLSWIKDAWILSKPYWTCEDRNKAILLLLLGIACNIATVIMAVMLNKWYSTFYNSLQQYNVSVFIYAIIEFCFIAIFFIVFTTAGYYARKILEIRWRKWMTINYTKQWLNSKSYYYSKFSKDITDNPDQRISEDISEFVVLSLNLTIGVLNSLITLILFISILWTLSNIINITFFGIDFKIHGYLVWFSLIYSIVGTYLVFKIGKPLINLNFEQQKYEANFRFNLVGVRENKENIALYKGEENEAENLNNSFSNIVTNFVQIVYRQIKVDILTTCYNKTANIFPLIVASPAYFAKTITLGGLMQIHSAFGRVQSAMSFFITSYSSLAAWQATINRLNGFNYIVKKSDDINKINYKTNSKNILRLQNFNVLFPDKTKIIKSTINLDLESGDRLLIKGKFGAGKTTLMRAIAGIWPYYEGDCYIKKDTSFLFISQKPYIPNYEFKKAISYPKGKKCISDSDLIILLKKYSLSHLIKAMGKTEIWSNILSLGEQQCLMFCRAEINKADIVFFDEATSSLDSDSENKAYKQFIDDNKYSTIISISHRQNLDKWHNKILDVGN